LHLAHIDSPAVGQGDVLIRVHATTVCAGDVRFRKADPFFLRALNGWTAPRKTTVLGMEFAGTVAALGAGVTRFAPGDRVFGSTGLRFGAYADYLCVADGKMVEHMPTAARFEDAAAIPYGGVSALFFLRQARVAAGQEVLVYGASGNVGAFAVQLAKHWGARVTAVCSARNASLVTSLGADTVIDYTREDFARAGLRYDIIFDTVGRSGFWRSLRALRRGGVYAYSASALVPAAVGPLWAAITGGGKLIGGMARTQPGDLAYLKSLVEEGAIKAVVDRCYTREEIVEAHHYVDTGRKRGAVVVTLAVPSL
jgi:NADPH:quinone reductase-like Zn-dependent oxidoreductase